MLDLRYVNKLPYVNPEGDRRTALILGGCSGIGWYTVLHLYLHGYTVYITGRSRSRVLKCIDELESQAMKVRLGYSSRSANERFLGELIYLELDLSNLKSVLQASKTLMALEDNLNLLIDSLSTSYLPYMKTKDGLEIQMQLHCVAPFLLISKLLPLLEKTVTLHPNLDPPKIIYTSSPSHYLQFRYLDPNFDLNKRPEVLFNWFRFSKAKLAGIHSIKMLALRNPTVLSLVVDPGYVMNPNTFSYVTRIPILGMIFWGIFQLFGYFFGNTVEEGSYAVIKSCLDPSLDVHDDNGKYLDLDGNEIRPSAVARDMDHAAETWAWACQKLAERKIYVPT